MLLTCPQRAQQTARDTSGRGIFLSILLRFALSCVFASRWRVRRRRRFDRRIFGGLLPGATHHRLASRDLRPSQWVLARRDRQRDRWTFQVVTWSGATPTSTIETTRLPRPSDDYLG
jgi:hypothetical protein